MLQISADIKKQLRRVVNILEENMMEIKTLGYSIQINKYNLFCDKSSSQKTVSCGTINPEDHYKLILLQSLCCTDRDMGQKNKQPIHTLRALHQTDLRPSLTDAEL